MYADMSQKLDKELKALTKPVPYHMQSPIKTFLVIPQLDPETQRLMQASYASSSPKQGSPEGLRRPLKLNDTTSLNAMKERL